MLRRLFRLNAAYRNAKEQAVEESVNAFEGDLKPYVSIFFFALLIPFWLGAVTTPIGPVEVYLAYGFFPLTLIFLISYFAFFLGSKIVFKPTVEELKDDTSSFALFSACERREFRSWASIGLAFVHTVVFGLYVISKDPKLLDALGGATAR